VKDITKFQGETKWLSNYAVVDIKMPDGITYPTTEHAYQAQKTMDMDQRVLISKLKTPKEARLAGKDLDIILNWDYVRVNIMFQVNNIKFKHPGFAEKLIETGDIELTEGNSWGDVFWGVSGGVGENRLGKILMRIRSKLQNKISKQNQTKKQTNSLKISPTRKVIHNDIDYEISVSHYSDEDDDCDPKHWSLFLNIHDKTENEHHHCTIDQAEVAGLYNWLRKFQDKVTAAKS